MGAARMAWAWRMRRAAHLLALFPACSCHMAPTVPSGLSQIMWDGRELDGQAECAAEHAILHVWAPFLG